ncbi:TIM23 translocase complex subunit Tim15 [Schizosaccharomyces japonicus yFS275]|uniref:TIM23 translocase complex subunit Tim15 n=1 Tax=Schizosaccharomyces japonicus (strain yFS275 / FY16936) TaxID=402676 RepID=B6K6K1_SCHJY|nr:TIM23 translocase complex subunit Tim15 [Schizosaccharomyces japonicus yFS275]EEB09155.1 TIM23 translocase complex subunit Tim15 [Schizosaccharomyces japonicus yFS275]
MFSRISNVLRQARPFSARNIQTFYFQRAFVTSYTARPQLPPIGHSRKYSVKPSSSRKEQDEKAKIKPAYQITFTCTVCSNRSTHHMSKQAYHNGTVLIQCPGCKNRHLIADHLKIFSDSKITIEDILSGKGEIFTKGIAKFVEDNGTTTNLELDASEEEPGEASDSTEPGSSSKKN